MVASQADRTDESANKILEHVTSYTESVGITSVKVAAPQLKLEAGTDPYPPGEIARALTRSYLIDELTVDNTAVAGDLLTTYEFPQALMTNFNIDKLKYYLYMRSKVKISFRINCTKFDYGTIMVSYLSYYNKEAAYDFREANLYALAQNNCKLMSIQQGATLELELPWINPKAYMIIDTPDAEIGTVFVSILHPLSASSTDPPANIKILVYAQFVDPEVAGYAPEATAPVLSPSLRARRGAIPNAVTQSGRGGKTVNQEAQDKSEAGVFTGIAEGVKTVEAVIGGLGGLVETGLSIASSVGGIVSLLALNKPNSVATSHPGYLKPDQGLSYGTGTELATKFSLHPEYNISTQKGIICADEPQPMLRDILSRPSLLARGSFNNSTSTGASITSWMVHPNLAPLLGHDVGTDTDLWQPTVLGWYTSFFSQWRGGLKYMIRFTCSSFMSCRVRLVHVLEPFLTLPLIDISGDVVSMVVDISGDKMVEFTIPYLSDVYYQYTSTPGEVANHIGYVDMYLETPIVSPDTTADPKVFFDIWVAAADDFRVCQPISPVFGRDTCLLSTTMVDTDKKYVRKVAKEQTPPTPMKTELNKKERLLLKKGVAEAETQCDVNNEFKKPFPGLVPAKYVVEHGLVNGEDPGAFANLLHRYCTMQQFEGWSGGFNDISPGWTDDLGIDVWGWRSETDVHSLLLMGYQFYRGSTRAYYWDRTQTRHAETYKLPGDDTNWGRYLSRGVDWDDIYCGFTLSQPADPGWINRFEVPWYKRTTFVEHFGTVVPDEYVHTIKTESNVSAESGAARWLYSMGDDLSVGGLCAVPAIVLPTPAPLTKKLVRFGKAKKPAKIISH